MGKSGTGSKGGSNTGSKGGGRGPSNQPANGGNWPATTGNPSGGNRGNAPPRGK